MWRQGWDCGQFEKVGSHAGGPEIAMVRSKSPTDGWVSLSSFFAEVRPEIAWHRRHYERYGFFANRSLASHALKIWLLYAAVTLS